MMLRELVIDSFAGGGGASTGIAWALGRDPDIAVNHDPMALAMHRINHPGTRHIEEDVVAVDARAMCGGRPIGLLWMSPDCKHHSKAKGGRPRERHIRGLAWTVVSWVKALPPWQRPRVVALENVEEFADWGPLREDGRPCPLQRGATFREFVRGWEALGYVVEWRERRAYISGARTIRKRLYMVMRRDGEPIVWPAARFGDPASTEVQAGLLAPWGTAAECIDWDLPCPSIFDTAEEIWRQRVVRAIRPLADNTLARIAKGTMRYVVNAERPFLVRVNHGDSRGRRDRGLDEPMPTATRYGGDALVQPFVAQVNHGGAPAGRDHAADTPAPTMTAGRGEALVTPFLSHAEQGGRSRDAGDPLHTLAASRKDQDQLVTPFLVPRYGERAGQEPRTRPVDEPAPTSTPAGTEGHLAAVHLSRQFGASIGSDAGEPIGTIMAGGAGKAAVVAAFLAQHNRGRQADGIQPGHPADRPVSTLTQAGSNQSLVAAHLTHAYTSNTRGGQGDPLVPLNTTLAGGNHAAAVYAFLAKYYGAGLPSQAVDDPLHTDTAKPRHGLVTVTIAGEAFVIVDIGMRMLTPRERYRANGFPESTIIDRGLLADGTEVPFTLEQQGRFCGNSVCPTEARDLVAANYQVREVKAPQPRRRAASDLFQQHLEAAE